jgi:hypothetical protein
MGKTAVVGKSTKGLRVLLAKSGELILLNLNKTVELIHSIVGLVFKTPFHKGKADHVDALVHDEEIMKELKEMRQSLNWQPYLTSYW